MKYDHKSLFLLSNFLHLSPNVTLPDVMLCLKPTNYIEFRLYLPGCWLFHLRVVDISAEIIFPYSSVTVHCLYLLSNEWALEVMYFFKAGWLEAGLFQLLKLKTLFCLLPYTHSFWCTQPTFHWLIFSHLFNMLKKGTMLHADGRYFPPISLRMKKVNKCTGQELEKKNKVTFQNQEEKIWTWRIWLAHITRESKVLSQHTWPCICVEGNLGGYHEVIDRYSQNSSFRILDSQASDTCSHLQCLKLCSTEDMQSR